MDEPGDTYRTTNDENNFPFRFYPCDEFIYCVDISRLVRSSDIWFSARWVFESLRIVSRLLFTYGGQTKALDIRTADQCRFVPLKQIIYMQITSSSHFLSVLIYSALVFVCVEWLFLFTVRPNAFCLSFTLRSFGPFFYFFFYCFYYFDVYVFCARHKLHHTIYDSTLSLDWWRPFIILLFIVVEISVTIHAKR